MVGRCMLLAVLLLGRLTVSAGQPPGEPSEAQREAAKLSEEARAAERRGDLAEAVRLQERALAMYRELYPVEKYADGHPDLARSLQDLGFHYSLRGQPQQALPHYREALAMRRKLSPPDRFPDGEFRLANTLQHLAGTLNSLGRPDEALPYMEEALAMCRKLYSPAKFPDGHMQLAGCINDLAVVLTSLGRADQALVFHQEALASRRRLYPPARFPDGHTLLAGSLNNLGAVLHFQGHPDRALPAFREALAMYRKLYPPARYPDGHPRIVTGLNNVGTVYFALRQPEQALDYWQQCLAMNRKLYPEKRFPQGHPELAQGLNSVAKVLYVLGKAEEALPYQEEALAMRKRLYPEKGAGTGHPYVTQDLHDLGVVLFALGRSERAIASLQDSLARRQQHFVRLAEGAAESEALQLVAGMQSTTDVLLSVAEKRQKAAATYAALWPGRAALGRVIERRHLALRAAAGGGDRPELKADWDRLTQTRRQLTRALLGPARGPNFDEQVRVLTERKEELERSLAGRLPVLAEQQRLDRLGPADLQGALPADAVFVDLLRTTRLEFDPARPGHLGFRETPRYVAFVLARDRLQRVELGDAGPVETALDDWQKAVAAGRASPAAGALRRLLWEPIARSLPADTATLYLAADNRLAFLPWAALPGDVPDSVLLERYTFAQVPHGRLLLAQLRQAAAGPVEGPILAVGAVAYQGKPAKPAVGSRAWEDLPGTRRELDVLRRLRPEGVKVLDGPRAGTDRLLAELPQARVVHLATHGFFEPDAYRAEEKRREEQLRGGPFGAVAPSAGSRNPLSFAGLVLAGANAPAEAGPDGGILSAETLIGLPLARTRLAVLSACQTGLGVVADGQCVQSLQWALQVAGCRDVVASLWKVDDDATAALMALFYDKLLGEKKPPLTALREAQLTLYRNPHLIEPLARESGLAGRLRGSPFNKTVTLPGVAQAAEPKDRSPVRSWAGFALGGLGR